MRRPTAPLSALLLLAASLAAGGERRGEAPPQVNLPAPVTAPGAIPALTPVPGLAQQAVPNVALTPAAAPSVSAAAAARPLVAPAKTAAALPQTLQPQAPAAAAAAPAAQAAQASGGEAEASSAGARFDLSGQRRASDAAEPPSSGGGSGPRGPSSDDYRATLARLGVENPVIARLEKASTREGRKLASIAAQVAHERPHTLTRDETVAVIVAGLLHGAEPEAAAEAQFALGVIHVDASLMSRAIAEPDGPAARALPEARRAFAKAWSQRVAYWAEIEESEGAGLRIRKLAESPLLESLPRGLKADLLAAAKEHTHLSPDRTQPQGKYTLSKGVGAMVEQALSEGDLDRDEARQWLRAVHRDPLTGLRNRADLDENGAALAARSRTLVVFKLDELKEVNDALDHEAGNKLLKAAAAVAAQGLGEDAPLFRRSPTGFALLTPAAPREAKLEAEALRGLVERKLGDPTQALGPAAKGFKGTVSIGVASLDDESLRATTRELALRGLEQSRTGDRLERALSKAELARMFAKDSTGGNRAAEAVDGTSRLLEPKSLPESLQTLAALRVPAAKTLEAAAGKPVDVILADHENAAGKDLPVKQLLRDVEEPSLRELLFTAAYRDRLSGLLNRRWLFDHLDELFKAGVTTHYIALDIDKFGEKNAALGEARADLILKELGMILSESVEGRDAYALHLSGEEFVILAGPGVTDARSFAEGVRADVEAALGERSAQRYGVVDPATGKPFELTISLGVAKVKHDVKSERTLELVTAVAETLLQRAKQDGRNRVEDDGPPTPAQLMEKLGRVIRVDKKAREIAAKLFAPPAKPKGSPFDNGYKTKAEVRALVGFDPSSTPGVYLSDPEKASSLVKRVSAPNGGSRVVKIAPEETIQNEILMRGVLESFEIFNESLRAPRAVAYRRWWPFSPVMVMEDVADRNPRMDGRHLPIAQRAAIAMFALTFGVHDLNPGAFVEVGWDRTTMVDFERARTETHARPPTALGLLADTPWISGAYMNELSDYLPALKRWKAAFARPESQRALEALLRRAGVPEERIPQDLALFKANLERLPAVLEADIAYANRTFQQDMKRNDLSVNQTRAISDINRAASLSPEGGVTRDVLRWLMREYRGPPATFHVRPEEIKTAAKDARLWTNAKRRALVSAAMAGEARSFDGAPLDPQAAANAFDRLASWLKP